MNLLESVKSLNKKQAQRDLAEYRKIIFADTPAEADATKLHGLMRNLGLTVEGVETHISAIARMKKLKSEAIPPARLEEFHARANDVARETKAELLKRFTLLIDSLDIDPLYNLYEQSCAWLGRNDPTRTELIEAYSRERALPAQYRSMEQQRLADIAKLEREHPELFTAIPQQEGN